MMVTSTIYMSHGWLRVCACVHVCVPTCICVCVCVPLLPFGHDADRWERGGNGEGAWEGGVLFLCIRERRLLLIGLERRVTTKLQAYIFEEGLFVRETIDPSLSPPPLVTVAASDNISL